MAVTDEGKDIEKRDIGVKSGDVTGKRNNKEKEKPLLIIIIKNN